MSEIEDELYPIPEEPCPEHKLMSAKMGYLRHHAWMKEMDESGETQEQCLECGRWLFVCEK